MQPQVRDLQQLIAEQNASLQPQYDLIDKDIQANDNAGTAQIAGLEAKKTTAFKDISQGANNRGMFFSGFRPNEEATYTAGTYLPALAQLQSTIASARNSLLGKKADLGKGAFDTAFNTRERDVQTLAEWNQMTRQQQFQASEADKARVFEATQNQLALKASASKGSGGSSKQDLGPAISEMSGRLTAQRGSDGYVSPTTMKNARAAWTAAGLPAKDFNANFRGLAPSGDRAKNYGF